MFSRTAALLQPPPTPSPAPTPSPRTATLAPAPSVTPTPTPSATSAPTALFPDLSGTSVFVILVLTLAIFLAAVVPLVVDATRAHRWRTSVTQWMTTQHLSSEDLKAVLRTVSRPHGTQGLTRSLIAALVLSLAGAALIVTLLSTGDDATDLRKTIVTALFTVLATVAGFYFGARTAETESQNRSSSDSSTPDPSGDAASISSVSTKSDATPLTVTVKGADLDGATILFGGIPSPQLERRSNTEVDAQVPPQSPGSPSEVTVVAVNSRGASRPANYTYP